MSVSNQEEKTDNNEDGLLDLGIPVPVQTFLWGQIAPFIRPKLGKLHEAACMFCQHAPGHYELKEACKSIEKVLVQNIHFGLSVPLTQALESIDRWRVVQAALPHVLHCAAALLHNRVKDLQMLGPAETKLLYTLHWILLFASAECADEEVDAKNEARTHLFSIPTISLFVYLFAPIVHHLKESDFQNYRLENGVKLWHGMWEFSAPYGSPCFTAAVKPKARQLLNSLLSPRESLDQYCTNHSPKSLAIYEPQRHEEENAWVSSPKDSAFPETIPEEASSVEEERVVIFRIPYGQSKPSFYTADASLLQQSQDSLLSKIDGDRFNFDKIQRFAKGEGSSSDKDSDDDTGASPKNARFDSVAATFLDVGVLRCLFILHWQEEGVYWCLHYIYNRLRKISEEVSVPILQARRRSNSLPIPQIEISVYQGTNSNSRDSPSGNTLKDFIEVPEQVMTNIINDCSDSSDSKGQRVSGEKVTTGGGTIERRANSERKRNVKIASFKSLIESKIFSKSEKELERIGLNKKSTAADARSCISQDETDPDQLLGNTLHNDKKMLSRSASVISTKTVTNLVKGKSMPSLTCRYVETSAAIRNSQSSGPRTSFYSKNPIITVTEHTPVPSPEYMRRQGSFDSQLEIISQTGSTMGFRSHMLRSNTDSHIDYSGADESEAPGSAFYITREGSINYEVVLLAVYMVFKRESNICSLRVLETGLNITEVLLDLGVVKMSDNAHHLVMGIIKRSWLHLGCPHGCNEGIRGPPAEFLRTQCQSILSRMLRQEPSNTRQYLRKMIKNTQLHELVEFFHAFVGFCVDPSSLLSPLSHKRHSAFKTLNPDINNMANNYATNFGGGANNNTEAQLIAAVFKSLVTRCVQSFKELKSQENMALYSDVRQLITYIKNAHGGTFRRVALSGSIDVTPKPHKKAYDLQTTRVIRHIQHSEGSNPDDLKFQRKLFFKKRSTSSACASLLETEGQEEQICENQSPISNITRRTVSNHPTLTPKHSERAFFPDTSSRSDRNSVGRLGGIVRWFRGSKDASDDLESGVFGSHLAASILRHGSLKGRRGDGIGRSLQRVRRRVERRLGRIGLGKGKKVVGGVEEATGSCFSRRSSFDYGEGSKESEIVVLKERRLIPMKPVREGMQRFNLLLEVCVPGTVPDPQLIGAIMDLPNAPVVTRAALLMECAHYVQKANNNQWASWIKQNLTSFRPSGPNINSRIPSATGIRRTHILQRAAGKMFYQWGEVIGMRLEEMLIREKQNYDKVDASLNDPDKQNELVQQDEEEDFLDEASVNPDGGSCPPALRLIACLVLYEITAFLRETYQTLPKTSKLSTKEKPAPWEKIYREANRRWSMALSSMGHSQTSAQSLQSIAGGDNERKISFVLHEPDNESENSSNTTVTMQGEETNNAPVAASTQQRRPLPNVRPFLLRRGTQAQAPAGGSFKRRSLKLRRGTKESKDLESDLRRTDSIQSRRKVSSISDRSDTSEPGAASGGEESPGILSDEPPPESPCDSNDTDDTGKTMPWTKSILKMINSFHYYCSHQNFCHPYCYQRNIRASARLLKAVRKVYGDQFGIEEPQQEFQPDSTKSTGRKDRRHRKVSDQNTSQTSLRQKENLAKVLNATEKASTEKAREENSPVLKYIKNHVRELFHIPMGILIKSAVVLTEEYFIEVIPAAWELLLEKNPEISASAAALYIIASVRAPNFASEIMQRALKHKDPDIRIQAILRYQVLWKSRFQVWPRMEEGAHVSFKVPPPGIEFTLPSPKIGIESLPVVDPPWCPRYQNKDMEVQLNQERHRSFVTATKTRKKQQAEAIHYAIKQQEDKQRAERESFLLTTIPITQQASHAPGLDHSGEDHNEAEDEGDMGRIPAHLHAAHSLFPSVLCSSAMQIVACLDDAAVNAEGIAVYAIAYQVIWVCLVEDSALFLRYVLERLTRDRQDQMFKLLRHLIRFVPRLPQQAAFALYNYIIGYVMFYVRSSHDQSQQLVGAALSVLWMVVHSVHGIMFKDLKQILRKEQCDASILLTANVPSAKKIIVHGPDEEGGIPSQFPVQEETQFLQLLRESLDFFSIEEKFHGSHVLIDYKTQKILNPNWYVRDLYFFKRSQYPQLRLVEMPTAEAFNALQQQELVKKFVEIGKVHLTWAILKNVDMVVQRVVFLHEELMKLPFFPRKALESDLDLYQGGELGKELLGLDVLHKFMWVRLIARMFEAMAGNFAYSGDIHLFLNVLSGAAILHSEDACIMRYVMATFINAAFNFKNIFSTNGYFLIMPTLLQVYSFHQSNKLVTTTIEYAVKQFYLLNRKPFIMQMFGAVSAILDTDEDGAFGDASKVQSSCLFNLLLSLETPSPDPLNIAELIKEPTPLKAIDFCYHDEDEMVTVLDCITLCVMVVSYSAENTRGYQMLIILEAILPCYMQQIQSPSYIQSESKTEREIILQLAVAVRTMVHNSEGLAKSYNGPYRNSPEHKGSSQRNCSRGPPVSPGLDFEDESHSKYVSDVGRNKNYETPEDSEAIRTNFRRARDVLLSVVGEFISRSSTRLTELAKKQSMNDSKNIELLDVKCHIRLADIAHSLLKVSPYDPDTMACRGLQRYMLFILPRAEWANDALKAALVQILRRLDKVFLKISKKPSIRRNTDWEAAAGLLKGIHETIIRHPYVLHWQQIKTLFSTVQNLIVNEPGSQAEGVSSGAGNAVVTQNPPAFFCSTVVRLIALQLISPVQVHSLEHVCGGSSEFATQEKAEGFLLHLLMPLCLKVCSGRGVSDVGLLRQSDISYLVAATLNAMSPLAGRTGQVGTAVNRTGGDLRAGSLTFTGSRDAKRPARISSSLYQAGFLSLRILCICFEQRLGHEWPRIVRVMRDLGRRNEAAPELWSFLEFVVTQRTPLYICLMPFILHKISQPPIGDHERHMQHLIRERMKGMPEPSSIKSRGALLLELARELRELKEELEERRYEKEPEPPSKREVSQIPPPTEPPKHQQRPSLISLFTGGQHSTSHLSSLYHIDSRPVAALCTQLTQHTLHPPRNESLSSSSTATNKEAISEGSEAITINPTNAGNGSSTIIGGSSIGSISEATTTVPQLTHSMSLQQQNSWKMQPPRLRFVSSVEFKHTSGETSTTPLSPESPAEYSSGENNKPTSRLQRSKASSRKTFRSRRGRHPSSEKEPVSSDQSETPKSNAVSAVSAVNAINVDLSWDSVSQTSSTSGYRDNNNSLQTGLLSPDSSLTYGIPHTHMTRSLSQHSLLMLFETQDEEDTLI